MRLRKARVEPLGLEAIDEELAAYLKTRSASPTVLNIFRTLAHDPDTMHPYLQWGSRILSADNGLEPRQREMVILRTGWLCRSGYEWTQHTRLGKKAGLTETEIAAIKAGPDDPSWNAADRALLRAADELHHNQHISDDLWAELNQHFSTQQVFLAILAAGQYTMVSMFLNAVGVQLEAGETLDPDLAAYEG